VGTSPAAVEVKRQARRAAQSSSPVLLLGETGTGKELLAHAIHAASARAQGPLSASTSPPCPTPCWRPSSSAWPLAPTPAQTARGATASSSWPMAARCSSTKSATCRWPAGQAVARAAGGGDRAAGLQQAGPFDARVIAATSRDLVKLVREGQFREDLYYRLNVLPIRVPPLRERSEDIPALVEALGEDMALRTANNPPN
jgi:DNA-binding NtrC family response regulator